jgi:hypothetical protein
LGHILKAYMYEQRVNYCHSGGGRRRRWGWWNAGVNEAHIEGERRRRHT